ncbi:histone H3 methyltransferase [Elaphomyces granulatus]
MADRLVIDLTLDSEAEDQTPIPKKIKTAPSPIHLLSLFTKHSLSDSRKRSDQSSDGSHSFTSTSRSRQSIEASNGQKPAFEDIKAKSSHKVMTISPKNTSLQRTANRNRSPIKNSYNHSQLQFKSHRLPSSTSARSRTSEFTGLSDKFYPTDAYAVQALKGAYPPAKKVNRGKITLSRLNPPKCMIRQDSTKKTQLSSHRHLRKALDDKLSTVKGPPVTLAFEYSRECSSLITNFEFVNEYKLQKGVERVDDSFNAGCNCGSKCNPNTCSCLSQEEDTDDRIIPYRELEDGLRVLTQNFLKRTAMIFECSARCNCDKNCWNRVVQHGRTLRFEIFHTGDRGFGLRSPDHIKAGQFIDCYVGEVISKEDADLREAEAGSKPQPSYLFSLDFLVNDDDIYVVDSQKLGAPTRYMNHSCNPNCRMFPVTRHHGDNRIYDLAFFSLRDLPPMTELTFDYNPTWKGDKTVDPNAVKCLCGEAQCRGQLWPNHRKSTKNEF